MLLLHKYIVSCFFSLSKAPFLHICHFLFGFPNAAHEQCLSSLFTIWDSQPCCWPKFLKLLTLFMVDNGWHFGLHYWKFLCIFQKAFTTLYLTFHFSNNHSQTPSDISTCFHWLKRERKGGVRESSIVSYSSIFMSI